jgi:hypothetical protein
MQAVDLLVNLGADEVVEVSYADRDNAAEEVEILSAVGIPNVLILGPLNDQGFFVVVKDGGEQELLTGQKDFVTCHDLWLLAGAGTAAGVFLPGTAPASPIIME